MSPARGRRRRARRARARTVLALGGGNVLVRGLWLVGGGIVASCALASACGVPIGAPLRPPGSEPVASGPREPGSPPAAKAAPEKAASAAEAAANARPKGVPSLDDLEAAIVDGVNRHRRAVGLRPLRPDPRIAEIARAHSRAMAAGRRGFGHDDFDDRSEAVAARVVRYRRVAENVSRHYGRRRADVPAAAISGWLDSYGHRRNIDGDFTLTGVGAAVSGRGDIYLTQIFVKPR